MRNIEFLEKNGIDVKKSLEVFGDINTYNETIGEFLVGIHTKINQLIKYMGEKDMINYYNCVRSMNGDAKSFGFVELAKQTAIHEEKSKNSDYTYISTHINDLINATNNAIVLIQDYMNGDNLEETLKKTEDTDNQKEKLSKKTILVVDDSNIIRNFVKRAFSDKYNVETAKDGEEAIQIIKANLDNNYIETILLDLNMPKVDGFSVLEYMRNNDLFTKMPVSIISGDSSKKTIDRAFTYDIVDMLEKPFNMQSVKLVVEKTLIYHNIDNN